MTGWGSVPEEREEEERMVGGEDERSRKMSYDKGWSL